MCTARYLLRPAFAFLLLVCAVPLLAQEDDVNWLNNYQDALKLARQTGKPIFLEYRCEP